MAYHVVTGQVKEIDDTREYEENGQQSVDSPKKEATNGHAKYVLHTGIVKIVENYS